MEKEPFITLLNSHADAKLLSPRPAELITLPSYMDCHDHAYTQIVIGLKGQAEFEVRGLGNMVGPGQGCVVTPETDHAFGGVQTQSDILVLNLPLPSEDNPLMVQRINELNRSDTYFKLDNQIQRIIHMLVSEMSSHPDDLLLSRACNDTVIALLQRHITAFQTTRKESRFDLDAIDRYIETHIGHRISVAQLAGSVYLGESQFHMLFKDQMGITPHQYVLGKRIDLAKLLIEKGELSFGQIADITGFSGQSTFTHSFSRLQGMSPSQYKKQYSVK